MRFIIVDEKTPCDCGGSGFLGCGPECFGDDCPICKGTGLVECDECDSVSDRLRKRGYNVKTSV
jgi:hypothetical protein